MRWSDAVETGWLTDLAQPLTHLGALPVAGGALVVTALVLLWRRHGREGLALLGGLALTYAGVHIAKAALGRPRPLDPLVDVSGDAYPSGHAAYAVCWVAIALALRHAFPRLAVQASLLIVGLSLALVARPHAHLPARALVLRRGGRLGPRRDCASRSSGWRRSSPATRASRASPVSAR